MYLVLYRVLLFVFTCNWFLIYGHCESHQSLPPSIVSDSKPSPSESSTNSRPNPIPHSSKPLNSSLNTNSSPPSDHNIQDEKHGVPMKTTIPGPNLTINGEIPRFASEGGGVEISASKNVTVKSIPVVSDASVKDKGGTEIGQPDTNPTRPVIEGKISTKSSVVPRKGAPDIEPSVSVINITNVNKISQTKNESHKLTINTNKTIENNTLKNNIMPNNTEKHLVEIKKKPESASDITEGDADEFSFIESSSTGKDYVLTGVAIFVCIWAIIFGALFFYKRAGELWDRRHYRRMDFLVEGMYND